MNKEELKQEAENFIIDRYKLNECYREDNAETREYMQMDVHSQYEEEYQLYLDATKELQEENAELKAFKKKCKFNVSDICKEIETENNLTKAKEIIKALLRLWNDVMTEETVKALIAEAEQFLQESE